MSVLLESIDQCECSIREEGIFTTLDQPLKAVFINIKVLSILKDSVLCAANDLLCKQSCHVNVLVIFGMKYIS